jgi:hypothetical protein
VYLITAETAVSNYTTPVKAVKPLGEIDPFSHQTPKFRSNKITSDNVKHNAVMK